MFVEPAKLTEPREKILNKLNIECASYEYRTTLVKGSIDALYGQVIIEYEPPKTFGNKANVKNSGYKHAVEQITKKYIPGLEENVAQYNRYFGIVIDGFQIGFVRYRERWLDDGPYPVNEDTIMKMLVAIRGLRKRPLKAETLNNDLGSGSTISKSLVRVLYAKLRKSNSVRVKMLYNDWKRVFSQVCGYTPKKLKGIERIYGMSQKTTDYQALLFVIHTYYALLMKLIAAEVATLTGGTYLRSYIESLHSSFLLKSSDVKNDFSKLEQGGIFHDLGIKNFLEGDYFSWYLDIWDKQIENLTGDLVDRLSEYEAGTIELEPEEIRDMLKKLYQFLVPPVVRRNLGEFYTPDWFAEFLLDEVRYDGDLNKRLLDPAVGSGTFMVSAIKRAKNYALDNFMDDHDALKLILKNIVGFDLNPLAVIAARTNYLLALGSLQRHRGREDIEIPIYLADSIMVETKADPSGKRSYLLHTSVSVFEVPAVLLEFNKIDLSMTILDDCLSNGSQSDEFGQRLKKIIPIDDTSLELCLKLYKTFQKLEAQNKDSIWSKIIKNSFAPIFAGKFDYVVGNPPWIRWENLPETYRKITVKLWRDYGLLERTSGVGLGKIKKDMAMLFTAVGVDKYLVTNGILGFLLPFTIFKSQAEAGFREYLYQHTNVRRLHDMVELMPFEMATNRTSMLIIENGKSHFPLKSIVWRKKSSGSMFDLSLKVVKNKTERREVIIEPITPYKTNSSWLMVTSQAMSAVRKGTAEIFLDSS